LVASQSCFHGPDSQGTQQSCHICGRRAGQQAQHLGENLQRYGLDETGSGNGKLLIGELWGLLIGELWGLLFGELWGLLLGELMGLLFWELWGLLFGEQ